MNKTPTEAILEELKAQQQRCLDNARALRWKAEAEERAAEAHGHVMQRIESGLIYGLDKPTKKATEGQ